MPMLPTVLNNQEIVLPIDAGVSCHMQGLWAQETPCENNKPPKSQSSLLAIGFVKCHAGARIGFEPVDRSYAPRSKFVKAFQAWSNFLIALGYYGALLTSGQDKTPV